MTKKEKQAKIIMMITKLFIASGREPTQPILNVWVEYLIHLDIRILTVAIDRLIIGGDSFPSISKINEKYDELKNGRLEELFYEAIANLKDRIKVDNCIIEKLAKAAPSLIDNATYEEIRSDYLAGKDYYKSRLKNFLELYVEKRELTLPDFDVVQIYDSKHENIEKSSERPLLASN